MHHFARLLAGILLFTLALGAAEFDHTIYDQYRIGLLSYTQPGLRLAYRNNHDTSVQDFHGYDSSTYDSKVQSSELHLALRFLSYLESEEKTRTVNLGSWSSYRNENHDITYMGTENSEQMTKYFRYDFNWDERFFLDRGNWFGAVDLRYSGSLSTTTTFNETIGPTFEYNNDRRYGRKDQSHHMAVKFGKGRVRNVTAVHRALQLLDHLEEQGYAVSDIEPDDLVAIAQALDSKRKYMRIHYRYSKFYWEHIAAVFDSLGHPLDDLDLYTTRYISEISDQLHYERKVGSSWSVGGKMLYLNGYRENSQYNDSDSLLWSTQFMSEDVYLLINPAYSLYRPLSLKSQVYFNAGIEVGPNLTENSEITFQQSFNLSLGYQYDITDRMMSSMSARYDHDRWDSEFDLHEHEFYASAELKYYLFDIAHIDLNYTYEIVSYSYQDREYSPDRKDTGGIFQISFTYGPGSPEIGI